MDQAHGLQRLAAIFLAYGRRFAIASAQPPAIGSEAAADAARTPSQLSPNFVAAQKLTFAHDALRAASLLWLEGHVHFVADYALFRASLECAAQAWWILAAPTSDARIQLSMRISLDDLLRARVRESNAIRIARDSSSASRREGVRKKIEQQIARLKRTYRDRDLPTNEDLERDKQVDIALVLQDAQESIERIPDLGLTLMWSMLSSIAHGSATSVNQLSSDAGRPEGLPANVDFLSNDPDAVLEFATSLYQFVDYVDSQYWSYVGTDPGKLRLDIVH